MFSSCNGDFKWWLIGIGPDMGHYFYVNFWKKKNFSYDDFLPKSVSLTHIKQNVNTIDYLIYGKRKRAWLLNLMNLIDQMF